MVFNVNLSSSPYGTTIDKIISLILANNSVEVAIPIIESRIRDSLSAWIKYWGKAGPAILEKHKKDSVFLAVCVIGFINGKPFAELVQFKFDYSNYENVIPERFSIVKVPAVFSLGKTDAIREFVSKKQKKNMNPYYGATSLANWLRCFYCCK